MGMRSGDRERDGSLGLSGWLGGLPPVGKQVIEAVVRVGAYAREQIAKVP